MSPFPVFEWTVYSFETPAIPRPCSRCGVSRPFRSTGKFRLNANGGRLDAWLIYRCTFCDCRWNRTVFERRAVGSVSPGLLEALQSNDELLARRLAMDTHATGNVSEHSERAAFRLDVQLVGKLPRDVVLRQGGPSVIIRNPQGCRARLDQILARGFELSRSNVNRLIKNEALLVQSGLSNAFRRSVPAVTVIGFHRSADTVFADLLERLKRRSELLEQGDSTKRRDLI